MRTFRRRRREERIFKVLMLLSTAVVTASLLVIVGTIVVKSLPALRLSMLVQTPQGGYYLGREGGILNAILGSLYLASGATLLAVLFSLPVVLYINLYARKASTANSRLLPPIRRRLMTVPTSRKIISPEPRRKSGFRCVIPLSTRASASI